jgi:hypothetical protein
VWLVAKPHDYPMGYESTQLRRWRNGSKGSILGLLAPYHSQDKGQAPWHDRWQSPIESATSSLHCSACCMVLALSRCSAILVPWKHCWQSWTRKEESDVPRVPLLTPSTLRLGPVSVLRTPVMQVLYICHCTSSKEGSCSGLLPPDPDLCFPH